MGILSKFSNNREQELQNELDSINILLVQKEMELKKAKDELNEKLIEEDRQFGIIEHLIEEKDELNKEINELQHRIFEIKQEQYEEKNNLLSKLSDLKDKLLKKDERIKKKDETLKDEQRKKSKYKYYFEHGAVDFSKAIALFNNLTDNNLSETRVRTFLVERDIIYKAGRNYAPTQYAEDNNYAIVYGEHGSVPPKYTFEFLQYLKQMVNEGLL